MLILSIRRPNSLLHDSMAVNLKTVVMGGTTLKKLMRFYGGPVSIRDISCRPSNTCPLVTVKVLEGWVGSIDILHRHSGNIISDMIC